MWFDHEEFARGLDSRPVFVETKKSLTNFIEDSEKTNTLYALGVQTVADNTLVGHCALESIQWNNGVCWLMIGIAPQYQAKGYGKETMQLLLRFAFTELNLHRVQLTVFEHNEHAIVLYEKLGFKREGTFREYLHRNNRRYEMYLYGLLRHEYFSEKPRPQV